MKWDSVNQRHLASFSVVERHVVTTDVALQGGIFHTKAHQCSHFKAQSHKKAGIRSHTEAP